MKAIDITKLNFLDKKTRVFMHLPASIRNILFKLTPWWPSLRNALLCRGDLVEFIMSFNNQPFQRYIGTIISENMANTWWKSWGKTADEGSGHARSSYISYEASKDLKSVESLSFIINRKFYGIIHAIQITDDSYTLIPAGSVTRIIRHVELDESNKK